MRCEIRDVQALYQPGDLLSCSYTLDFANEAAPSAIETSVIWMTCGKGTEDIGVHFFERRQKFEVQTLDRETAQKLTSRLPNSPFTYQGEIVKISWCVRIRVFLTDGRQLTFDRPFQLGSARWPEEELRIEN